MARSKSAARTAARKSPVASPIPASQLDCTSLYARLQILKAVNRLIRTHGSAAAADRALMPHLHGLPIGLRAAFWLSVSMSLHRRAAAQVVRS
jgi:hypothetical protein